MNEDRIYVKDFRPGDLVTWTNGFAEFVISVIHYRDDLGYERAKVLTMTLWKPTWNMSLGTFHTYNESFTTSFSVNITRHS